MSINQMIRAVCLCVVFALAGCATRPAVLAEKWHLPKRASADSSLIIGRIDLPDNKEDNPKGYHLNLNRVVVQSWSKTYFGAGNMPRGEGHYIMDDTNYFVVPIAQPGKYHVTGFITGDTFNSLSSKDDADINVRPGQIVFVGSFEYIDQQSALSKFAGLPGSYSLRNAKHPTELEMLQWLNRVSAGSGWETVIRQRIRELGGKA